MEHHWHAPIQRHRGLTAQHFQFADFTLDVARFRLERGARVLRLEKLPMDLLILLVERHGDLVSRDEIADCLWGKKVFVDVDHSINTAVRKIRIALHDDPEKPRFVETVVGKGYRFSAPVIGNGDSSAQVQSIPHSGLSAGQSARDVSGLLRNTAATKRNLVSRRVPVLLAVGLVVLIAVALVMVHSARTKSPAQPVINSLAVLPLKNLSGDPTQEYLADGMTEALIGRLATIRGLRVISRTSAMSFKDTHLSAPELAKALHVDALVEGSVIHEGDRVRVHAQLIRGATDEHFWSETYDRELRNVLALQSDIAQAIATKVEVTLSGEERERLTRVRPVATDVYESYLKGRFVLEKANTSREIEESVRYFEAAITKDPSFAPAYLGLADAYGGLGTILIGSNPAAIRPKIMDAVQRALELDPQSAEAHVSMGDIEEVEWNWTEAEQEYRRALELNPNYAAAYIQLAHWLNVHGRTEEALSWAHQGRERDPRAISGSDIAWILFCGRRFDEAERELRGTLAVTPNDAFALWYLGFVLIAENRPKEAIAPLEKSLSISSRGPGVIGVLIRAYAHAGRRSDALRLLSELRARQRKSYVPSTAFVNAYLGLGDYEQTFVWLDQAYKEKSNILLFLRVHPYFDPVRNDPRFVDLIHRVGLDQ